MILRYAFALLLTAGLLGQVGCVCTRNFCCGDGCGLGGQVYDCGCPSCGVADSCCDSGGCDASCGVADSCCGCDPACGVADTCCDPGCGCPDGCGSGVCGGGSVSGRCPLFRRMRAALMRNCCGCSGCGGSPYWSEWHCDPPCDCDPCGSYGNYKGGPLGTAYGRRAQLANRQRNIAGELQFSNQDEQIIRR